MTVARKLEPMRFTLSCLKLYVQPPTPVSNSVGLGRRARIIKHLQVMLTCWSQEQLWEVLITLVLYRWGPFMIPLDSIPLYKCTTVHMHNLPVMGVGVVSSVLLFQQYCVEHFFVFCYILRAFIEWNRKSVSLVLRVNFVSWDLCLRNTHCSVECLCYSELVPTFKAAPLG